MRAIILAAGRGSRMGNATIDIPKGLVNLWGKSLISWQLESLCNAGIEQIAVVRGYLGDMFEFDVHYFENLEWSTSNMVYSLQQAEEWLQQDTCIISYSDIVYPSSVITKLLNCEHDLAISYDVNWRTLWEKRFIDPLIDAERFRVVNETLLEIGGSASNIDEIQGQYMGLLRIMPAAWSNIVSVLDSMGSARVKTMDMTSLLNILLSKENMHIAAIPINEQWFEVDSEQDLDIYTKMSNIFI